jgi:hypothetical protein
MAMRQYSQAKADIVTCIGRTAFSEKKQPTAFADVGRW